MEFMEIADVELNEDAVQCITVRDLSLFCSDIDRVLQAESDNRATVYCVWGEFVVERQLINGGLRFSLPGCPNAFAWTITAGHDPAPEKVVVHGTINRTDHDPDFIESIEDFLAAWKTGLEKQLCESHS